MTAQKGPNLRGNKSLLGLILLIALVAPLWAASNTRPIVKVGVLSALSGDVAIYREISDAMLLRFKELNADSQNLFTYQPIVEDTQFEPMKIHLAAQKLITVDKVDALIPIGSVSQKIALPLCERAGVPMLAIGDAQRCHRPWSFNFFINAEDFAALIISTAKSLGVKSLSILSVRDDGCSIMVDALQKSATRAGIRCAEPLWYNSTDAKDYRPYILRMRDGHADLCFLEMWAVDYGVFFNQARQLGFKGPFTTTETWDVVDDKKLIEGRWIAGCPVMKNEFKARLRALGLEPTLTYTPYGYDLVSIYVQAIEKAGRQNGGKKPSGRQITDALASFQSVQTTMGTITQDANGSFHPMPVLIYYGKGGVPREVSQAELKALLHK